MWLWSQTGNLYHQTPQGEWLHQATGVSGQREGANNPQWQTVPNEGPLPCGTYTMQPATLARLGPIVFSLLPSPGNSMLGRSAFYIHWAHAGSEDVSSEGCIVLFYPSIFATIGAAVRQGDNQLVVSSQDPPRPAPPL